jgi:hypothetical protein
METCPIEMKAKVKGFNEGLEPTEINCPFKEFCDRSECIFIRNIGGDVYLSDEAKLAKLRIELKQIWTI